MPYKKERIARLSWNDNNWVQPSGEPGKSKDTDSFEYNHHFGYEEWTFDIEKLVNGYHYGHIEAVSQLLNKSDHHVGEIYNIHFFAINSDTRERWWIGHINNIEVVSDDEADKVTKIYNRNGWTKEMSQQLKDVKADYQEFNKSGPIFRVKFKPKDMHLLDIPITFSHRDPVVKATYLSTLYLKKCDPRLNYDIHKPFVFRPGMRDTAITSTAHYGEKIRSIDRQHERIRKNMYIQLENQYGTGNVSSENSTGDITRIDITVRSGTKYILYEIKTNHSLKLCIREAIGQLLEYGYWNEISGLDRLIIVTPNPISSDAKNYFVNIRKTFNMPIYYQQYLSETKELDNKVY